MASMTPFRRREWLLAALAGPAWPSSHGSTALAFTWRGPSVDDPFAVGVVDLPDGGPPRLRWHLRLPGRAHGLAALPGGGLVVVAARPGPWLWRVDGAGRSVAQADLAREPDGHRLDGHAQLSVDGQWLLTPQTDPRGLGWVAWRDPQTLAPAHRTPAHGIDPHHLLLDDQGHLLLALGGIRRTADGRKVELDRMQSALVRLHRDSGALLGRWQLDDPRLSLRHLAWSGQGHYRRLGIALQAEHDDPAERAAAPLLALWDGQWLQLQRATAGHAGYAGDIAPAGGGFALSAQKAGRGVLWSPDRQGEFARITEPCALASAADAVWLAGAAGLARWHPHEPPAMWRWPQPLVADNHAVVLAG